MTYLAGTGAAFVRACAVALAATGVGLGVDALLRSRRLGSRARLLLWALVLAPFLTPSILVGYGWQTSALILRGGSAAHELLYALLVTAKLAPAAAVVLHFAPRAISAPARHCHALLLAGVRGRARRLWLGACLWLRGEGAAAGAAFSIVFLLAFAEFEMASLVSIRSTWTVSLFEAHAGGLALGRSVVLALVPLVIELAALAGAAALLVRAARTRGDVAPPPVGRGSWFRAATWAWLALAAAVVTAYPAWVAVSGVAGDPGAAFRSLSYFKDIAASVVLGLAAGGGAFLAAGPVARRLLRSDGGTAGRAKALGLTAAVTAPGLLGALVLALAVLALFQLPALSALFDTPVPLAITVTLLILPFAILLRAVVDAKRPAEALHLAGMLRQSADPAARGRASGIAWSLDGRRRAWVGFLLFAWGYFDMTASSILAPSGATPVFVTLYNFMHYGRKAATSAMVAGAFVAPLVVLAAGGVAARVASRARA
ncbi:MAG: hypothetical protein ACYS9X_00600 [Planctomycetota bacterium]